MVTNNRADRVEQDRRNANQGQFFFAAYVHSDGQVRKHPVFVLGKNEDSNDTDDVLVCQCTKADHPVRSDYDIQVQLKKATLVRTNKIYTLGRDQLEFRIVTPQVSKEKITELLRRAVCAISAYGSETK